MLSVINSFKCVQHHTSLTKCLVGIATVLRRSSRSLALPKITILIFERNWPVEIIPIPTIFNLSDLSRMIGILSVKNVNRETILLFYMALLSSSKRLFWLLKRIAGWWTYPILLIKAWNVYLLFFWIWKSDEIFNDYCVINWCHEYGSYSFFILLKIFLRVNVLLRVVVFYIYRVQMQIPENISFESRNSECQTTRELTLLWAEDLGFGSTVQTFLRIT